MSTLPRWLRGDVGAASGVAVGSVALAGIAFELWNADLGLPLSDARGDVTFIEALVKAILDHGWFLSNPDLGAPVGQHIHDMVNFSASNLQFALIWAIGLFSSDPATVLNLYFLLGFALVGVAAFLVMRRLGVSAWPAAVCALLFSVLPDHFLRGEGHLTLATYFPVPIGAYLALAVATDRPLFERRAAPGRRPLAWLSRLTAITLALCAVVAVADLYYAVFTVLLIAVAAAFRALADRRWAPLAAGGVAIGAIALVFVVNLAPNLLYVAEHGRNPATDRDPIESELFGLTVGRLVLPDAGHRSETLAEVGNEYRGPTAIGERNPRPGDPLGLSVNNYIGMIAVAGLALLLAVALASLLGRPRGLLADPRLRAASALSVASILVATAGGISIVVAFLVTPQIRSWNRISVVIAFLALLAVAVLLDAFRERAERRRRGRLLFGGALAAVLALGFLDQTNPGIPPDAASLRAERDSTEALVDEIERRIPDGEVLQLPHQTGFPDSSTLGAAFYYDSLNPYLFSEGLSWSGNPMEGRPPEDWARSLQGAPPASPSPPASPPASTASWSIASPTRRSRGAPSAS